MKPAPNDSMGRHGSMQQWMFLLTLAIAAAPVAAQGQVADGALRVCADPNNMPFSNRQGDGFENKIAELIAADMGVPVQYSWMPQRRGFIRRTLNAHTCDLVTAVPAGYELVSPTKPYYRSSYVFVYATDRGFNLRSFDDPVLRTMKIGLQALVNDGYNPPPGHALARRGIVGNIVGYTMWDAETVEDPPRAIIDAVASGEIDVAIVWGPMAGYFARHEKIAMTVVPVSPEVDEPAVPFQYEIAMGVRRTDTAFKQRIEEIMDRRHSDIDRILAEYDVPLVTAGPPAPRP
jgi:mxaJ protein